MPRAVVCVICAMMLMGCHDAAAAEPNPQRDVGPSGKSRTQFVVATGQLIRPAGRILQYNSRPVDLALSPDGKTLYAKDTTQLAVIDVANWSVRQTLLLPEKTENSPKFVGSMHGLAVSRDGAKVLFTG